MEALPVDAPQWLKPYLAASIRAGLVTGWQDMESGNFDLQQTVTGAEAAVVLQNALDLPLSKETWQAESDGTVPEWAAASLAVMEENGITLSAEEMLTRGKTAQMLYQVSRLAMEAPGTAVFRMQQ